MGAVSWVEDVGVGIEEEKVPRAPSVVFVVV